MILVEPNGAGGWTVTGPPEAKSITDLFDPEGEAEKRQRARQAIEEAKLDLLQGGLSVEKLASRTKLPAPLVEAEMKAYAKANPGLVAKKLDGRFVLFREGSAPAAAGKAGRGRFVYAADRPNESLVRPQGRRREENRLPVRTTGRPVAAARPGLRGHGRAGAAGGGPQRSSSRKRPARSPRSG